MKVLESGAHSDPAADTQVISTRLNRSLRNMARLEEALNTIVEIFIDYSDNEGKKFLLDTEELRQLLAKEINSEWLKEKIGGDFMVDVMSCVDESNDGQVSFKEFFVALEILGKAVFRDKVRNS